MMTAQKPRKHLVWSNDILPSFHSFFLLNLIPTKRSAASATYQIAIIITPGMNIHYSNQVIIPNSYAVGLGYPHSLQNFPVRPLVPHLQSQVPSGLRVEEPVEIS